MCNKIDDINWFTVNNRKKTLSDMVEPKLKQRPSNPLDLLMSGMTGAHFEEFSLKKTPLSPQKLFCLNISRVFLKFLPKTDMWK